MPPGEMGKSEDQIDSDRNFIACVDPICVCVCVLNRNNASDLDTL